MSQGVLEILIILFCMFASWCIGYTMSVHWHTLIKGRLSKFKERKNTT